MKVILSGRVILGILKPMELKQDDIKRLGDLARIKLTEAEVNNLAKDLNNIVTFVEELSLASISDVTNNEYTIELHQARADEIIDSGIRPEDFAKIAPKWRDNQVEVKTILEESN